VASSLNNMGACFFAQTRYALAQKYFKSAHELAKERLNRVHPRLGLMQQNLDRTKPLTKVIHQEFIRQMILLDPKVQEEMAKFKPWVPPKENKKSGGKKKNAGEDVEEKRPGLRVWSVEPSKSSVITGQPNADITSFYDNKKKGKKKKGK